MRIRWWQSIRWRLTLGSVLLALLATGLLTLIAMLVINYYYQADQEARLSNLANDKAQNVGLNYAQTYNLARAVSLMVNNQTKQSVQEQQPILIVLDRSSRLIYPRFSTSDDKRVVISYLLKLVDPSIQKGDLNKLYQAITKGLHGVPVDGQFSRGYPVEAASPFIVRPIFAGGVNSGALIGVLVITPRANTLPAFVSTVGEAVLIAFLVVVILAALVAILFSRTITRPLAKLIDATRILAAGDYSAQVHTDAQGELGELARNFNEMAAQLNRDVEELRKQELWRRELIMSITHDLATPLTAIAGLGEALVDGVNQSRDDYEATGRIIVRETLRLRRLVQDLHMMAKVEGRALHPQRREIRLAVLVDEVLAVLAPEFERAHVEPRNAIPYTLPTVQVDADMLARVFSNLCDNALHYTPAGGIVTIEAEQQDSLLVVAVTDTGEGIPSGALSRIFERFFRVDSARQSTTGGSGLGLAIVRAIIEAHGGKVWAENAQDAGARIVFTLPLRASSEPSEPEAEAHNLRRKVDGS
ncbi:HAMP domain-containing histidine kinase [Ktedonosporobacter rubrisoli]|uniref:histidine kinase n=1 Tax=Ktedonosporobacter rubrisoli TaxID=2509675 RepID=A0A4P6JZX7_KTERU|nr:HAMP domain-containing sensor histidine kinase [Ktedonosporobacter rubrisoli]QBD81324.1 HAMP domain-containing histidine kinase [Ktedonosporobacter rubrisoli]